MLPEEKHQMKNAEGFHFGLKLSEVRLLLSQNLIRIVHLMFFFGQPEAARIATTSTRRQRGNAEALKFQHASVSGLQTPVCFGSR